MVVMMVVVLEIFLLAGGGEGRCGTAGNRLEEINGIETRGVYKAAVLKKISVINGTADYCMSLPLTEHWEGTVNRNGNYTYRKR